MTIYQLREIVRHEKIIPVVTYNPVLSDTNASIVDSERNLCCVFNIVMNFVTASTTLGVLDFKEHGGAA